MCCKDRQCVETVWKGIEAQRKRVDEDRKFIGKTEMYRKNLKLY